MQLPVQGSATSQWKVWDYRSAQLTSAAVGASGTALITVPPVPDNELWFIDRLVVQSTSTTRTDALIYAGDVALANIIDGSHSGNLDFADYATPHLIKGTVSLQAQWSAAVGNPAMSAGAIARLYVQYTVLRRQDPV